MPNIKELFRVSRELRDAAERLSHTDFNDDALRAQLNSLVQRYDAALKQKQRGSGLERLQQSVPLERQPSKGPRQSSVMLDVAKLVPGTDDCLFFPLQPADTHETLTKRVRGMAHYHGWKLVTRSVLKDDLTGKPGVRVWRKT